MKRIFAAVLAALALTHAGAALAQREISIFAAQNSLSRTAVMRLVQLIEQAFEDVVCSVVMEEEAGKTLRELVLADCAPQIVLCAPQEAAIWAREGMLLEAEIGKVDEKRIAGAVLAACRQGDMLFMAPLVAHHRQMAVNCALFEEMELEHLLRFKDYPVWLPMQLLQALDEFYMADRTAMELWPVTAETGAAVLAFVQSLCGGALIAEDGERIVVDSDAFRAGVSWLEDVTGAGLIGMAQSREEALARFLSGKTAIFADWTQAEAAKLSAQGEKAMEIITVPYPSSAGATVRAFDLVGAAAFAAGDAQTDALSREIMAFIMEDAQAQLALGEREIWADGAQWLVPPGTSAKTVLLRSALCDALCAMLAGEMEAGAAVETTAAAVKLYGGP